MTQFDGEQWVQHRLMGPVDMGLRTVAVAPNGDVWTGSGREYWDGGRRVEPSALRFDGRLPASVVGEARDPVPAGLDLLPTYPNPFNRAVVIAFGVPRAQHLSLQILNVGGQTICTFLAGQVTAGMHRLVWRGNDSAGRPVSSGTLFCRLVSR